MPSLHSFVFNGPCPVPTRAGVKIGADHWSAEDLDGGVAHGEELDAVGAEIHFGSGLVAVAGDRLHRAEAEVGVQDAVSGFQAGGDLRFGRGRAGGEGCRRTHR